MRRLFEVLFVIVLLSGCSPKAREYPFKKINLSTFANLSNDNYAISNYRIRLCIDSLCTSAKDTDYIDVVCDQYYATRHPYLWIDRKGTDLRCDTLLQFVEKIDNTGFPSSKLYLSIIKKNLKRLRNLDFDKENSASKTMASLEYYLTKSYLRYARGQRYGFINPRKFLNHLDKVEKDSTNSSYRELFSIPIENVNKHFIKEAIQTLQAKNLNKFLTDIQPHSSLYKELVAYYNQSNTTVAERKILALNIERSRWRIKHSFSEQYIIINIPSQQLTAYNTTDKTQLSMKVCYGSPEHKTPLLISHITYLELNPYWIIPQSIVKRDIIPHHLNDTTFYNSKRFKIIERSTGNFVSPLNISPSAFNNGEYFIRQDKGEDNSLGKIIFRFPNPFSIYLHDTNNRETFTHSFRAVSHGCIRLEKPFDLAAFLFSDKDPVYLDLIRLAINLPPETEKGKEMKLQNKVRPLKICNFDKAIELYIFYYTAFPLPGQQKIEFYPDIYGYDKKMASLLFD